MLKHRDLKEKLERLVDEKELIEDDMLGEGDRLTNLMLSKERKECEKGELEIQDPPDEGRIMELEEELYQVYYEMNNITETLDTKDSSIAFLHK